jgi:hypothetical protein
MPLHHHRHHHHSAAVAVAVADDDDEAKPRRPYSTFASPRAPTSAFSAAFSTHRLLVLFSVACLLVAAASLAFAFSARAATLQPPPLAAVAEATAKVAFRCGRAEDTLRAFLASTSGNNSTAAEGREREKVLAVVGVHTEIGSAARRAALRATWFPPKPEGIVRFPPTLLSSIPTYQLGSSYSLCSGLLLLILRLQY